MKYDDPTLKQQLAGAYALGSLQGAARARFERLLEGDTELRRLVVSYQEDLTPLALEAPLVQPPARVRKVLAEATAPRSTHEVKPHWWKRLGFWRGLATANAGLAIALVAFVGAGLLRQEAPLPSELVYVGVLSDPAKKPGVAVLAYNNPFRLEIAAKEPLMALPDGELRLWIRDRDTNAPVFLARIPSGESTFALGDEPWKLLRQAKALIITREPAIAAATPPGQDILYEGVCVNLKKWSHQKAGP